jgi:hypothetical protein
VHVVPGRPHVVGESDVHVLPMQQPVGHDVESHAQTPPTHRVPDGHAAPPPHVQVPAVQPSAFIPHRTQARPPPPHAVTLGVAQLEPEQQPVGHVVGLHVVHTPPLHTPPVHAEQAAPPVPHALVAVPAMHVVP